MGPDVLAHALPLGVHQRPIESRCEARVHRGARDVPRGTENSSRHHYYIILCCYTSQLYCTIVLYCNGKSHAKSHAKGMLKAMLKAWFSGRASSPWPTSWVRTGSRGISSARSGRWSRASCKSSWRRVPNKDVKRVYHAYMGYGISTIWQVNM